MRKLIALLAVAAVAVTGAIAATAFAATERVKVGDNYFVKKRGKAPKVTVSKGTTVKWVWRGDSTHNVRVTKGPVKFQSKFMSSGTFKKKMRVKGTYRLVCDVHGAKDQSMRLVVN